MNSLSFQSDLETERYGDSGYGGKTDGREDDLLDMMQK
jgi:hypothetical protein